MSAKPKAPKHTTGSKRKPSSKAGTTIAESRSKWIRIDRPFPLPAYVRAAIDRLDDEGHVSYVVGGSVRDWLLGGSGSHDHDLATDASPDELHRIFPDAVTVGKAFGVLKIPVWGGPHEAEFLEIATFREDLGYNDHRHPKAVKFSGPEQDAQRRDFTINGLFFDPKTSRILDCVGGVQDLNDRVIRAIGDPAERFREDALRLLRAARFSARLGFQIEAKTSEAIKARAKLLHHVSGERIRDELTAMWTGPHPADSLVTLQKLGLLAQVLPEVEALRDLQKGEVFAHTIKVLKALERAGTQNSPSLAWAAVLIDSGKGPASRRNEARNFNGHELEAAKIAVTVGHRLKMPRSMTDMISALLGDILRPREVFKMRESTLVRLLSQPHSAALLELHRADAMGSDGNLAFYEFMQSRFKAIESGKTQGIPRLIDGTDLIQLGFSPGKEFSEILRVIEDLAIEGKLDSKEQALEYVVQHFVK